MAEVKGPPWDVGDEIVLFAEFVDAASAAADPDECVLQIGRRDGEIVATFRKSLGELVNPTLGRWEKAYVIPEPGLRYSWDATGTIHMAEEGTIPTRIRTLAPPA